MSSLVASGLTDFLHDAVEPQVQADAIGLGAVFALMAVGIGLVFAPEGSVANWFIFVPGLVLLVASVWAWVRAAGHEWHDVERRPGVRWRTFRLGGRQDDEHVRMLATRWRHRGLASSVNYRAY